MATILLDPGTDATGDLSFWTLVTGPVSSTALPHTGNRSILCATAGASASVVTAVNITADTHGRLSAYLRFDALPTNTTAIIRITCNTGSFCVGVTSGGILQLFNAATAQGSTQIGSNGKTLAINTWYRIAIAFSVTSLTVYSIATFVDGVADTSVSNSTALVNTGGGLTLSLGWQELTGSASNLYFDDIYLDNSSSATDTGNINVCAKQPASNNTNSFDTAIGANPANRWTNVNEVPLSTTNGWEQAGATQVSENYGLQTQPTASSGSVDLSESALVSRTAWLYGKAGANAVPLKANSNNNGKATGTTLLIPASTGTLSTAVGDVVVVMFGDLVAGVAPTIADNLANTWTQLTGSPATNGVRSTGWIATVAVGKSGNMRVTVTFGSSSAARAGVMAVFDATYVTVKDADKTFASDSTSPYDCPTSGTLAQANEVVIGMCFANGIVSPAVSDAGTLVDTGLTSGSGATTNVAVSMSYRSVNTTAAVAPQFTLGTNRSGVVATQSLKMNADLVSAGTPALWDNGAATAITLTTTAAIYTLITDSTTYPSNAAGIGMKSTGATPDTFLYECGTIIAYIPGPVPKGPQFAPPLPIMVT